MNDESFDRTYQAGRANFNDGIDKALKRVGRATSNVFRLIHRIEFDAPWAERNTDVGCA